MTTRAQLEALVERVGDATGPDREIDAFVCEAIQWAPELETVPNPIGPYTFTACGDRVQVTSASGWYFHSRPAPLLTASIDAVVALIERELPGWAWKVVRDYVRGNCCAVVRNAGSLDTIAPAWVHTAAAPPLALLAAFLSAKLSSLPEEA